MERLKDLQGRWSKSVVATLEVRSKGCSSFKPAQMRGMRNEQRKHHQLCQICPHGTALLRSGRAAALACTNSSVQKCSMCKECGGSIYGGGLTVEENRTDHRVLTVTAEASKSGVTQTGNWFTSYSKWLFNTKKAWYLPRSREQYIM